MKKRLKWKRIWMKKGWKRMEKDEKGLKGMVKDEKGWLRMKTGV